MSVKLTKAQQRVLDALPTDGSYADAYKFSRHRSVRVALNNQGVTEPQRTGPVTCWWMIRPTALGLKMRSKG
jgi:hypothetical protein